MNKILVAALVIVVFGAWFAPQLRVANDYPNISQMALASGWDIPRIWTDRFWGLGLDSSATLWSWPTNLVYGFLGKIGLPLWILERIGGVFLAIGFGLWGMRKLSGWWAAMIFIATSYFLLLIDGGQITLAVAYSLLPVCFYLYLQAIEDFSLGKGFRFALATCLLSVFDIRVIYFLLVLIGIRFLYNLFVSPRPKVWAYLQVGALTATTLLVLHAYWLVPAILVRPPSLPINYSNNQQLSFLDFTNWKHSLLLQQPHWPKNIFGEVSRGKKEFILLPLLAISALALVKKNKQLIFWAVVSALGVFLAKGASWPLGSAYSWLFSNLPGFSLFRDSTKWFFLSCLGYSVLIGQLIPWLEIKWKWVGLVFFAYLLFLTRPVWLGQMTGTFSTPRFESDYLKLNNFVSSDNDYGRVLWLPSRPPLGSTWTQHPPIDALKLQLERIIAGAIVGNYETLNWIRDASYSGQLLSILGVKYVIYPPLDPLRDNVDFENVQYNQYFQKQLETSDWVKNTHRFGPVAAEETKSHQGVFWIPKRLWFVIGSDEILKTQTDLANDAMVFVEDQPGLLSQINRFPQSGVKLYEKSSIDLAANLVNKNMYFPASTLKLSPDKTGWWKRDSEEFLWWRNFLHDKYQIDNQDFDYQGGWAMAEGNLELSLPNFNKEGVLLVRVMTSSVGGELVFRQKDTLVGKINTHIERPAVKDLFQRGLNNIPDKILSYQQADMKWVEVGTVVPGEIHLDTKGTLNIINSVMVVSQGEWQEAKKKADLLLKQQPVEQQGSVIYTRESPTRYRLQIKDKPSVLIFSQTFDSLWEVNGQKPIEVYGFLNAFPITGAGEYTVFFSPQKYVWMQWLEDIIQRKMGI